MLSDLQAVEAVVSKAKCPEEVFGALDAADLQSSLKHSYHQLVKVVHPDRYANEEKALSLAQGLFSAVTTWRKRAEEKIDAKTYGDNKPHVEAPPKPASISPQVIQTPKRKYIVSDLFARGDLADLYHCAFTEGGVETKAVFKIAQSAADNDFMDNEQKMLNSMYSAKQPEEKFYRYLPKPLDSFLLRGTGGNRRVNVLQLAEDYVSLEEVMHVYPMGIDFRDCAWMLKRCLAGLGFVHSDKSTIHGGITPAHVLVHPTGHGAKIVDWCYAARDPNLLVKAISKKYKSYYAPEILKKLPVTGQTDLFMLAKCFVALLGGNVETNQMPDSVPKQFRAFLSSCLIPAQSMRPDDAWKLHEDLDALLLRIGVKPSYRWLEMPAHV